MGRLIDGKWSNEWYTPDARGRFVRADASFRAKIAPESPHPPDASRYHLYVSYACPWAHRTLIARALLSLSAITVTVVDPFMGDDGWVFSADDPDPINHSTYFWQVYVAALSDYTGRVTVPVLWDKVANTIVNNESREIIRMFDQMRSPATPTLAPESLRPQIDSTIDAIYQPINNGVYRAGFATSQQAYEEAATEVFKALDHWNDVLSRQRYLCGETLTEADICLFTTLFRFDPVYYGHFKCNVRRIVDYEHLWGFVRDVYQHPGVAATCRLDHIKQHYYRSHPTVNPTRIVPIGPALDHATPHDRARLARSALR